MSSSEQDAYAAAGVSQRGADASVEALVRSLKLIDTGKPSRVVALPNHYASVLRVSDGLGVAFATDGVGTKMLVADRMGDFTTIGIDCIAMNVNDLVCVGAEPIALLDFILCREADPEVCGAIGAGLRRGAELAGVEIPGGEIAQVGDIVSGIELSGSAIGLVDLDAIVDGGRVEPGDVLIGLPSSGLHSNGYTLARKVLFSQVDLDDDRLGRPLGEILLEPTTIYVREVLELLASPVDVRGLAHITGDGLNNLTRLAAPVGYEITDPLDVPAIFELIGELGEVPEDEMYEVFNMGCGFVCVIAAADEEAGLELLRAHHPEAKRIGVVTDRAGTVERVG
jgi:phosphoribosylformylglycinamidine cyclo-ligase